MKRLFLLLLAAVLLLTGGCSFKVEKNTFNIDRDKVDSIEIQREYEEKGESVYRCKKITDPQDLDQLCKKLRTLPVYRAGNSEPHPIDDHGLIILIQGSTNHHLVLSKKMAYYDQIAYDYKDKDLFSEFIELYDNYGYEEEATDPTLYADRKLK